MSGHVGPEHDHNDRAAAAALPIPRRTFGGRVIRDLVPAGRALRSDAIRRWVAHCASRPMDVTARPAVVFAPHQDDETFGCGGLIALKRRMGARVHIVVMTDGGASHGDLAPGRRASLVALRNRESIRAAAILGVDPCSVSFLGYPDGRMGSLSDDERGAAIDQLASLLARLAPAEVYLAHREDRMPDHEACARLVLPAVERLAVRPAVFEYVVWRWWLGGEGGLAWMCEAGDAFRLNVSSVLRHKRRAIDAHRSQLTLLPPAFIERFFQPYETFFRARSAGPIRP